MRCTVIWLGADPSFYFLAWHVKQAMLALQVVACIIFRTLNGELQIRCALYLTDGWMDGWMDGWL